jgi:hypothetical protein
VIIHEVWNSIDQSEINRLVEERIARRSQSMRDGTPHGPMLFNNWIAVQKLREAVTLWKPDDRFPRVDRIRKMAESRSVLQHTEEGKLTVAQRSKPPLPDPRHSELNL